MSLTTVGAHGGRIDRVDSLEVVNNLDQRVASNINNAAVHTDRHILNAAISNSHSHTRGVRTCLMRYRVALCTSNRQITFSDRLNCLREAQQRVGDYVRTIKGNAILIITTVTTAGSIVSITKLLVAGPPSWTLPTASVCLASI